MHVKRTQLTAKNVNLFRVKMKIKKNSLKYKEQLWQTDNFQNWTYAIFFFKKNIRENNKGSRVKLMSLVALQ